MIVFMSPDTPVTPVVPSAICVLLHTTDHWFWTNRTRKPAMVLLDGKSGLLRWTETRSDLSS
ncbi:hypothetical protein C8J33_1038 [Rhizobium sp. PP-CC-3G-465]|nr:hypothetical protein C8J33_1038 [Rhizobium sp. PP-CC-3G-465]